MKPLYVFLDTNIFLHFQPFDQIRWTEVLNASRVILMMAPVVIRELDKHKDQHRLSTIRDRARTALKKIEQSVLGDMNTQSPDDVELEYAGEPTINFEQHGLRTDVNDDHLIATCLTYRMSEPGGDMVLVAGDTGPRLKAIQRGIRALPLPERYKLPDALDAAEKEKKQLQRRIQQLENRFPKLQLAFADKTNQFRTATRPPFTLPEEEIQRQIARIKNEHSKRSIPRTSESEQSYSPLSSWAQVPSIASQFGRGMNEISPEEIQRYNDELDKFYRAYENFLREYVHSRNLQHRTVRLDIRLFNYGTAPAEDIDVYMHFPDGFDLYDEDTKPRTPEKPAPPLQPQTETEKMMYRTSFLRDFSPSLRPTPYIHVPLYRSSPKIERSNSYEVAYSVNRLKQHMNEPCEPLYVTFHSLDDVASFSIDYRINAADLPNEEVGTLHVVVDRG